MPTSVSHAGIGIRIIQIPGTVQANPQSAIYIVDRLLPSSVVSQRIEVSNSTNAPMSVLLYPSAATNVNGVFSLSSGETTNDLTSWTTIAPASGVIAAHGTMVATVTITVPAEVTSGEQFGVIWAAAQAPMNSAGIVNVSRVGIRMYDPIGAEISTTSSTQPATVAAHHSLTLDLQWVAIGALCLIVIGLLAREIARGRRKRKKRRKRREGK